MKKKILLPLVTFLTLNAFSQNHIRLVYEGGNANVQAAVTKANEILNSTAFYDSIRKVKKIDFSSLSGAEIAARMEKATQSISVVRKTKPIANASTKTSDRINISRSLFGEDKYGKFVLSIAVNTLIHETVHAVDYLGTGNEFTHDGNSPEGQENTAPWVIGAIAEKMLLADRL